jgi:hypothetical protein
MNIYTPDKPISSLSIVDQHRRYIAECCKIENTTVCGLFTAYNAFRRTPGCGNVSIYSFMMTRFAELPDKNQYPKLNAEDMRRYMNELRQKEKEQAQVVPSRVQARRMDGDEASILSDATNRPMAAVEMMDVDSVKSGHSGMRSIERRVGNMGLRDDESMDGDESMNTAHSERDYMPTYTRLRRSHQGRRFSRIDELPSDAKSFDLVNYVMLTLQLQDGVIETDELVEGMTNEEISSSVAKLDAGIQTLQKTKERMLRQLTRNTEGDAGDAGPKANMQAPDGEIHINGEGQG